MFILLVLPLRRDLTGIMILPCIVDPSVTTWYKQYTLWIKAVPATADVQFKSNQLVCQTHNTLKQSRMAGFYYLAMRD